MTEPRNRYDNARRRPGASGSSRSSADARRSEQNRYSRDSARYTASSSAGRDAQRAQRNPRRASRSGQMPAAAQGRQRNAEAMRYSRDRYVAQDAQHRSVPAGQRSVAVARRGKPVNPKLFAGLCIAAVVLLAIIIIRMIAFGGTAGEYNSLRDSISTQQQQLTQLEKSSTDLQVQMDSMQATIDTYNKTKG